MSKNIKLNDTNYNGVSTVQLPTVEGRTATFKDTDEITTPTGTKTITENGTFDVTNFAQAIVNVASSGGGTESASGTFVGDGTRNISLSLPATAEHLVVYSESYVNEKLTPESCEAFAFLVGFWSKNRFVLYGGNNYNASKFNGVNLYLWSEATADPNFTLTFGDSGNFADNRMTIGGGASKTVNGETYHWVAW